MARKEDILAQCIADVKAGRVSVEDCLARYPHLRRELEPLLRMALEIKPPPEVSPSPAFKARARAQLMQQIHAQRPVTKGWRLRYYNWTPAIRERRYAMPAIVIVIVLALVTAGGGTAYASQGAIPGDILYPEKTFIEDARLFFAFSDETKAGTYLDLAGERLEELSRMPAERSEFVAGLVSEYQSNMDKGLDLIEQQIDEGKAPVDLLTHFQASLAHHQEVLETVHEQVPEEAKPAIELAMEASGRGGERVDELMASTYLNQAIQRLIDVSELAQRGEVDEATHLLEDYDSDIAAFVEAACECKDTEALIALLEESRDRLLTVFDQVLAIVPEEARGPIECARLKAMTGFDQAIQAVGRGEELEAAWGEFELEWQEFGPEWQGQFPPGTEEWWDAWEEFRLKWQEFRPEWQGQFPPGSEEWHDAWDQFEHEWEGTMPGEGTMPEGGTMPEEGSHTEMSPPF